MLVLHEAELGGGRDLLQSLFADVAGAGAGAGAGCCCSCWWWFCWMAAREVGKMLHFGVKFKLKMAISTY